MWQKRQRWPCEGVQFGKCRTKEKRDVLAWRLGLCLCTFAGKPFWGESLAKMKTVWRGWDFQGLWLQSQAAVALCQLGSRDMELLWTFRSWKLKLVLLDSFFGGWVEGLGQDHFEDTNYLGSSVLQLLPGTLQWCLRSACWVNMCSGCVLSSRCFRNCLLLGKV